ncbi:MAG: protein kinase [Thermoleophilia bacterium]
MDDLTVGTAHAAGGDDAAGARPPGEFVAPGDRIGGYLLQEVAGSGGMGVVYRARESWPGRDVAVKLIAPELAGDPAFRELFMREAETAARLEHPNVLPVLRAGEDHGWLFIAMRYVRGTDLRTEIARLGRLPPARLARIVGQVAAALDAAHVQGIVHRDVKPANVLLSDAGGQEHAYLSDFGVSVPITGVAAQAGRGAGTAAYLAPEQITGGVLDARTDVYALGCVAFHALTGRPPFADLQGDALLQAHLHADPPRVSSVAAGIPTGFDDVITRALAKDPRDRFATAGALAEALLGLRHDVVLIGAPGIEAQRAHVAALLGEQGLDVAGPGADAGAHQQVQMASACAVLVDGSGLGPWARDALAAVDGRAGADPGFRPILVLLPGAPDAHDPGLAFTASWPWVDLRPGVDAESARRLSWAVRGGRPVAAVPGSEGACPYRGLDTFQEADAELFVGRERDVARLLDLLRDGRFLAVVAPSGHGKSSLVRAGLVPAVRSGALPGSASWRVAMLTPGAHPMAALTAAVDDLAGGDGGDITTALFAARTSDGDGVLLVVDQLEEAFTLCADARERTAFLDALRFAATIPDGRTTVVVTLRADFYPRLAEHEELRALVADRQHLVGAMAAADLRRAVEEPAARCGLELEPGLSQVVLEDVTGGPGGLPLLQYLLLELWRRRRGNRLTLEAYSECGGVDGALARRADEAFEALTPSEQATARRVLLRLVQPGEGTEDTRRRVALRDLTSGEDDLPQVERAVNTLVAARLVTAGSDAASGQPLAEIAHEALIRAWPTLRRWIDGDRERLRLHRQLSDAATEWDGADRDEALLYRGARLGLWREQPHTHLNDTERAFLAAGTDLADREQAARRRRLRVAVGGLGAGLVAVGALAGVALWQRGNAVDQRQRAQSQALANASRLQLGADPELAVLLAQRAVAADPTNDALAALSNATQQSYVRAEVHRAPGQDTDIAALSGGKLALVAPDGTVDVWDPAADPTGAKITKVAWPAKSVHAAASTAAGVLVTGGDDGRLVAGDPLTGNPRLLGRVSGALYDLVPVPGTDAILTAGQDGVIRRWSPGGGSRALVRQPDAKTLGGFGRVAPIAGGVVTQDLQSNVALWRNGRQVFSVHLTHMQYGLQALPGGKLVVVAEDNGVSLWRVDGASLHLLVRRPLPYGVNFFTLSGDGHRLMTGGGDGVVRLWTLPELEPAGTISGHVGPVSRMRLLSDGRLASLGNDSSVRIWDAVSAWAPTITVPDGPAYSGAVTALANGRVGVVTAAGALKEWAPGGAFRSTLTIDNAPYGYSAAVSPSGDVLAVGSDSGDVVISTAAAPQRAITSLARRSINGLALDPSAHWLVAANGGGGVYEVQLAVPDHVTRLGAPSAQATAVARSRGLTVAGDLAGSVTAWAEPSRAQAWTAKLASTVNALAFSADGRFVAGSAGGSLVVWNAQTGASVVSLSEPTNVVRAIAFSPSGRFLATAGDAGLVVWDWHDGRKVLDIASGVAHDLSVAFVGRDGEIAYGDDQNVVHLTRCDVCTSVADTERLARQHVSREFSAPEQSTYLSGG